MTHKHPAVLKYLFNFADCAFWCTRNASAEQVQYVEPHFSLAIISVTVQLWI